MTRIVGRLALFGLLACGDGRGSQPSVEIRPSRIDFGSVLVGRTGLAQITLENHTGAPLFVERFQADEALRPAIELMGVPPVLPPDRPVVATASFRPLREGPWVGDLRLSFDEGAAPPVALPVTGLGTQGRLAAEPNAVDFGRVRVGETETATVTIRNLGVRAVLLRAVTFEAGSSPAIRAGLDLETELAPGGGVSLPVRFTPNEPGRHVAVLRGATNARESATFDVLVSGDGALTDVVAEPSEVVFEGVFVGSERIRTVRLRNQTFEERVVEDLRLDPPQPGLSLTASVGALAPGAWLDVALRFAPRGPGSQPSTLVVWAPPDELRIPIEALASGQARTDVRLSENPLHFGSVQVGHRTERFVTLRVGGSLALAAGQASVTPGDAGFRWSEALGAVSAGDERRLKVVFEPLAVGFTEAELRVGTATRTVTATVVGAPGPELEAWPPTLDFGGVPRGTEAVRRLELRSLGALAVRGLTARVSPPFAVLEAPSQLGPADAGALRVSFRDDATLSGLRTGVLELLAEDGVSVQVPLRATVRPLPLRPADVLIRLRWNHDADLDLHVSREGAPLFDAPESVSPCNPQPRWDQPGLEDDPWLDVDARTGPAVETFRLETARAQRYRVDVVHRTGTVGVAEVEIEVLGTVVARATREIASGRVWTSGTLVLAGVSPAFREARLPLSQLSRAYCD